MSNSILTGTIAQCVRQKSGVPGSTGVFFIYYSRFDSIGLINFVLQNTVSTGGNL